MSAPREQNWPRLRHLCEPLMTACVQPDEQLLAVAVIGVAAPPTLANAAMVAARARILLMLASVGRVPVRLSLPSRPSGNSRVRVLTVTRITHPRPVRAGVPIKRTRRACLAKWPTDELPALTVEDLVQPCPPRARSRSVSAK